MLDERLEKVARDTAKATEGQPLDQRADAVEEAMAVELGRLASKSIIYVSGDIDVSKGWPFSRDLKGAKLLMGQDPRLPKMPDKPTLLDFFKYRFGTVDHLLQSAKLAMKAGHNEKIILACLLHDIAVMGFIRADHGYWGAQMIEPYVDEEVAWAIRYHQSLRFFPDEANGYHYPELYTKLFGPNYNPAPYIHRAYEYAKGHKWYMSARLITINDIYAWEPETHATLDEFTDIIGRNFRQPKEGLGYDNSPSSHIWRTIIAPTRAL